MFPSIVQSFTSNMVQNSISGEIKTYKMLFLTYTHLYNYTYYDEKNDNKLQNINKLKTLSILDVQSTISSKYIVFFTKHVRLFDITRHDIS